MKSYSLHRIITIIQLELHWSQPFVLNVGQIPLFVLPNEPNNVSFEGKNPQICLNVAIYY